MKPLRTVRVERLMTIRELAAQAGVSTKTVVQAEKGRQTPTFKTMQKISSVLNTPVTEIEEFRQALDARAKGSS